MEDRERFGRRVEAGVVAERAFGAELVLLDVALENDLGMRRDLEVDGDALDELDRRATEIARHHELVDVLRQRRARGVRGDRIHPERYCDGDAALGGEPVGAAVLVDLPVHEGGAVVDHLHAIHADVADAVPRVPGDDGRERDERRRVAGPAALDRESREVDVVALEHDLLHRARFTVVARESAIDFSFCSPRTLSISP